MANPPEPVDLVFVKHEPSTGADPNKLPLIVGHGMFSRKEDFGDLPAKLADQTKRIVYSFDLRDHGESPRTGEFTFAAMTSDVLRFVEKHSIPKAAFCGHSLSGWLFTRFATLFPDRVESLTLLDINPVEAPQYPMAPIILQLQETLESIRKEKPSDLKQARKYADELLAKTIPDAEVRNHFKDSLIVRDDQIDFRYHLNAFAKHAPDMFGLNDIPHEFSGPSLEIYGSKSHLINKEHIPGILKRLPNCQFVEVEGADHAVPMTHSAKVIEAIVPFLAN